MLRQAENRCKIEGVLAEVDIKPGSFVKNGQTVESIGGSIIVKVIQKISGEEKELAIPVHMFASKLTNKGTPNPAYDSIKKIMDEYTSIAASENGEDGADRIRITSGSIRMNEYYSQDGRLVSFPRINASFVQKINKSDCKPEATYTTEFVVANKSEELDRNGDPTGRYRIDAIIPQYGGKVDVVPMYAQSPGVISAVSELQLKQLLRKLTLVSQLRRQELSTEATLSSLVVRRQHLKVILHMIMQKSRKLLLKEN